MVVNVLVFGFLSVFFTVLRGRNHLLTTLMALELLVLLVVSGGSVLMCMVGVQLECMIYVVVSVSVCEASLGLSLLVAMMRARGSVQVKALLLCW